MGQFSWLYSDTGKQVVDNKVADTYLLVPEPFQEKYGKYILEKCYDGYGNFGGHDVYDLIPEWNKEMIPEIIRRCKNGTWNSSLCKSELENLQNYYEGKEITCPLRYLGIAMACSDENNFALEYPIKITSKKMNYKDVDPSKTDPNQGWEYDDNEDGYYIDSYYCYDEDEDWKDL